MPIYEYKCSQCETVFEKLTLSHESEEEIQCTKCASNDVTKLLSAGTIRSGGGISLPSAPLSGCGGGSGFS